MATTTLTIVVELDNTEDCPAGSARLPGGPSREFHGWLGLTEAIDSLARTHTGVNPAGGKPHTERSSS